MGWSPSVAPEAGKRSGSEVGGDRGDSIAVMEQDSESEWISLDKDPMGREGPWEGWVRVAERSRLVGKRLAILLRNSRTESLSAVCPVRWGEGRT